MLYKIITRTFFFSLFSAVFLLSGCQKADSEIIGCVYGKIKGSNFRIALGCMTRVEFDRYLDSPYQTYNGQLINRDLTFTKVDDCIECQ
ncbi:MAG: hypothetical protein IT238_03270 [Bacteroidia bacterium]|nr:hypothetical protein [Bacteroidia bacterium]MCZ2249069.1 hypothetical protein [Bacteroidia bacterium]